MTETMKAAVFGGPGLLELRDVPIPQVGQGEVLLKVAATTVCGTDVRILRGEKTQGIDLGIILGHEIAGYVAAVGPGVQGFAQGDLVGLVPTVPCGRCVYCVRGLEHLCIDSKIFGYAIDGGLAEYLLIPAEAIDKGVAFVADPRLSPVEVALAEPLGCVLSGADNYRVEVGDTVVIMGAGPIGLLHLQVALLGGASQVIVSDPSSTRGAVARRLGATEVVDPTATDLRAFVMEKTGGLGADVAVICIGRSELFGQAITCVRKRGRVSAFAGFQKGATAEIDPNLIHYGELEITGASNASRYHHGRALRLISEGKISVKELHTRSFPLSQVIEAIEYSASGEGIKAAIISEK